MLGMIGTFLIGKLILQLANQVGGGKIISDVDNKVYEVKTLTSQHKHVRA